MSANVEAPPYYPARLTARADIGGGLTRFTVDPGPRVSATYTSPGQYTEVRIEGETGYFVLAGDPGAPDWQLVMRSGGGASDVLLQRQPGALLEVTAALGSGFPMRASRQRPVVVAVAGTGIAASLPLVRHRVTDGDAERTIVLVGVRSRAELPLAAGLERWAAAGVSTIVCLSQDKYPPDAEGPDAVTKRVVRYASGYVQDALRRIAGDADSLFADALVFAVGPASMVDAVREAARDVGIPRENVLTNH